MDCVRLLSHLAAGGHKASLKKMQYYRPSVTFLGYVLFASSRAIAPKRSAAIASVPKPRTKKQLLSFLGLCGCSVPLSRITRAMRSLFVTSLQVLCRWLRSSGLGKPQLLLMTSNLPFNWLLPWASRTPRGRSRRRWMNVTVA